MARTLTEDVYEKLRDDIINLRLRPGEKLSEAKLAARFEVSRAPIRSVIERLRREDLVIVRPQIGTIISPISFDRAIEVLEVRLLLEPHAAGAAAERIGDDDLEALRREVEALGAGPPAADNTRVDTLIHETVWRNCGNREIATILNGYRGIIRRIQQASVSSGDRLVPSRRELVRIFQALARRDPDAASQAMRAHLINVERSIRAEARDGVDAETAGR